MISEEQMIEYLEKKKFDDLDAYILYAKEIGIDLTPLKRMPIGYETFSRTARKMREVGRFEMETKGESIYRDLLRKKYSQETWKERFGNTPEERHNKAKVEIKITASQLAQKEREATDLKNAMFHWK